MDDYVTRAEETRRTRQPANVPTRNPNNKRLSWPLNHDLEAAQPRPLLDRHTTLPMQLYLCSRSDVGAIADSLLWL